MENNEIVAALIASTAFQVAHSECLHSGKAFLPKNVSDKAAAYIGEMSVLIDTVKERISG